MLLAAKRSRKTPFPVQPFANVAVPPMSGRQVLPPHPAAASASVESLTLTGSGTSAVKRKFLRCQNQTSGFRSSVNILSLCDDYCTFLARHRDSAKKSLIFLIGRMMRRRNRKGCVDASPSPFFFYYSSLRSCRPVVDSPLRVSV